MLLSKDFRDLPPGFLLGTATSAHQIEGGTTNNDWSHLDCGAACDHWNRLAQDIKLMRDLGANAYRFSLEWSRLEPRPGEWDEAAWEHYRDELEQLHRAGIEPVVTLLHFILPLWLAGATDPNFPARFERFAREAARRLGQLVRLWCTLNEPNVQMLTGYVEGIWPPGLRDPAAGGQALLQLARAHALAYRAVRRECPGAQIGVVLNLVVLEPASPWSPLDRLAAGLADQAYNWAFLDAVRSGRFCLRVPSWPRVDQSVSELAGSADFLGVNYYTRFRIRFAPRQPGRLERVHGPGSRTDMDWEIHPEGLLKLLRQAWERYRLPLYVTENGIADASGDRRPSFLQAHLQAVMSALGEGLPVRGYFHWSLLDNFEWAEGFEPRFGLHRVDYPTQKRTPAPGWATFRAWSMRLPVDRGRQTRPFA